VTREASATEEETRGQSPSQTIGPFFHPALVREGGNVLVNEKTRGERIRLAGRVIDGKGSGVDDALLEIWQPDANGFFAHPADPNADDADPHFAGFGRAGTDEEGRYAFHTIKPPPPASSPDDGQAPFIDLRVFARGLLVHLVTRIYFGDERNDRDPVLRTIDPSRRASLIAGREETTPPTYRFDVRLQGRDETVFFDV